MNTIIEGIKQMLKPIQLTRTIILTAMLLLGGMTAKAQAVIMNGNYFLTHDEAGTDINTTATNEFDPATCLWVYASRDYIRTANSEGNAINNNNNYLQYTSLSLGTDWGNWYRGGNNEYIYNRTGNSGNRRYHYPTLSGTTWGWAYNQTSQGSSTALYDCNITTQGATSTNPTITGLDVITATGNTTYTASGASYRAAYTNYYFRTANHYFDADGNSFTGTPANATLTNTWSLTDNAYVTVNSTSGVVTVSSLPEYDITLTLTVTATATGGTPAAPAGTTLTGTKTITILGTKPSAPIIEVSGTTVTISTDAVGETSIRYTLDGTEPTASNGTVYSGPIDLSSSTTSPVTVKAVTVRNGNASDVSTEVVTLTLPEPVITADGSAGTATITCDISGATIYYTLNGSEPTTSSNQYTGSLSGLSLMTTIKAIAIKDGWNDSPVASATVTIPSGVSEHIVTLFDYEDHNFSYYQPSSSLPTGYPAELHSPDPRNVKITYKGNGQYTNGNAVSGVKVGVDADAHTFVYYKTLEKGADNKYAYTTIPNPFSVRPKSGTTYYGFSHWKVTSISGGTIDGSPTTINAETEIKFVPSGTYTTNCTSMEVVLEAVWDVAEVSTTGTFTNNYGVERMFYVVPGGNGNITAVNRACTYSSFYPNGTTNGTTGATLSDRKTHYGGFTATADSKIEYVVLRNYNNRTINAAGYNFTIGRGVSGYDNGLCATTIQGLSSNSTTSFRMRIESGSYDNLYFMGARGMTSGVLTAIVGSDYDRANNKDNSKLRVYNDIAVSNAGTVGANNNIGADCFHCTVKSGNYYLTSANPGGNFQFYISSPNGAMYGKRTLIIEGGYFADISGGFDTPTSNPGKCLVDIRVKGGQILGALYGAAQYANAAGDRKIIITGGDFEGWIAGGANGTQNTRGTLYGSSFVYVGGKANVTSNNSTTVINRAVGGNVFGAGCGYDASSTSGQVTIGTNVAIADNAIIERGVYGGGSYGYTTATSNIYILGGTVNGQNGGVNGTSYLAAIDGGVYGGACQNQGGTVNIIMDGGTVNGSVYGGSNYTGTLSGTSTVTLNGGTINGSLYGGGNGEGSANTNVTGAVQVTVNGGTVTDAVYGCNNNNGAPQSTVNVDIYGTDPAPSTDAYALGAVFGGGNRASYSGTPEVKVHNCTNSIEYVYGGGNAAHITGNTDVTIYGGNKIGTVFGGGNGTVDPANVSGSTSVKIYGGTIGQVFGGSNSQGTIGNTITVIVNKQGDSDPNGSSTACDMKIGEVYGGGNEAGSAAGSITIGCTGTLTGDHSTHPENIGTTLEGIGAVYGGANQANITGDITLTMSSGIVSNLFGGNNTSGTITGGIQVKVEKNNSATCADDWYVGNVFGGGNLAPYTIPNNKSLAVSILNGTVSGNVYGGGKGLASDHTKGQVTGNPVVTIGDNVNGHTAVVAGDIYGGGDAGNVVGTPQVNVINKCNTSIAGDVYGGGNAADVSGTDVNIDGGNITGMVFGGGHGDKNANPQTEANVTNDVSVTVTGGTINKVFGGSNSKGTIDGDVTVYINKDANSCEMHINEVYGGGNEAAGNAGTITIECTGDYENNGEGITTVYGGANAADVGNSINLTIKGGHIDNVYGGNNQSGSISGTTTVTVNWDDELTCGKYLGNVFGGGNLAALNGAATVNIQKGTVSHNVYGGGNQAGVGSAAVSMTGGSVLEGLYGGCNTSGTVSGAISVSLTGGTIGTDATHRADVFGGGLGAATATSGNIGVTLNGTTIYGDLYGGSALGQVNGSTDHTTTLTISGNGLHGTIYGGGKGSNEGTGTTATSNGNVIIDYNTANTNLTGLYGGANINGNVKGDITVNVNANVGASGTGNSIDVFGGGLGAATNTEGNVTVNVGAADGSSTPTIYGDIYGGSALGNVNNEATDLTTVNILNGTVHGNVYGGGLGDATVLPNGYLAPNATTTDAIVNGTVHVNIGTSTQTSNFVTIDGKVFGCNNLAGTPKGPVYVDIYRTAHSGENFYPNPEPSGANNIPTPTAANFAISEVYGGGNLAHYTTTVENASTHVHVHNCDNTIQYVYGGGNAANTVANEVTIDGGRMEYVFGGGNGAGTGNPGANVEGNAIVNIDGGIINYVFGGSNTLGVVNGVASMTFAAPPVCTRMVKELYGGGNEAPGGSVDLTIPCGVTGLNVVYGGSKNADIGSETLFNGGTKKNVTLTIEGGVLDKIFGGNNQGGTIWGDVTLNLKGGTIVDAFGGNNAGGNIKGTITVNVEDAESTTCPLVLTNVFGGGKDAAYTPADATISGPLVNIKHKKSGTSITGSVFGGGQGSTATVTANPVVTVGDLTSGHESYIATIDGDVYGGGDAADVVGTTTVLVQKCNTVINGDVYGGGNAANIVKNNGVGGTTSVTITGGTITGTDHGMVFGGGHGNKNANPQTEANVAGNVSVTINGGTINKVFGGSNSKGTIGGTVAVNVNKTGSCDMKVAEVYGGGNEAAGNAGSITIGCTGTLTTQASTPALIGTTLEGVGAVYGGANKADIGTSSNNSNITLTISSGIVGNVYGGNNTSGTIHGTIQVNVNKNAETCGWYVGNVFGGGNLAQYTGAPAVNIKNGTVSGNVYGGGMGLASDHTKGQVTGNPVVTIGDNTTGHESYVAAVTGDVYGGGDAGNVVGTPQVNVINKCNTTIGNVYGGGNAADVNGTDVNIDGGTITGMVFGGGHGDKTSNPQKEANVNGNVAVDVTGGTINKVFGGSNSKGSISGTVAVNINKGTNSCDMHITEVYGGGNEAAGNAGTITIGCTGTASEGIGDVYGGANAADINNDITLNITGGKINNVYGGNNSSGTINGDIVVNVEWTGTCGVNSLGNVYGAGNMAAYTGSPLVNIKNGTVSQNVYGGGKGNTAVVTGAPVVTIGDSNASHVAIVTGDVYGGGDAAAVTGNTSVTYDDSNTSSSVGKLFGGGNAAGVSGTATVALVNGKVDNGIYGGCNSSGNIGGKITVNVNGGTLGSSANLAGPGYTTADVFGGGYGSSTSTSGDVEVNINGAGVNIYGDVYGGSALGNVNDAASDKTTVNILNGTLHSVEETVGGFKVYHGGNVYGGGLGDGSHAAAVNGEVIVNIGSGTVDTSGDYIGYTTTPNNGNATIEGNVYGCNNTNGSPQQNVTVNIFKTAHVEGTNTIDDSGFAIANVFGGGNEADYTATGKTATVNIYGCDNTIRRTFGGGNAAEAPHVVTFIQGGHIYQVFGGGNGERGPAYAANITEGVSLQIHGGNVEQFFGGSNQNGAITGGISTTADSNGPCGGMEVDEFFCGGNFADITGNVVTTIYCSQGMEVHNLYGGCNQANIEGNVVLNVEGGIYQYVYGGSKGNAETPADISGTVTLNLYGGTIENVFGGSNINGNIGGSITVNVLDIESTTCPLYITNIYGGSNLTSYEPDDATITSPVVNVVHAKHGISGNVYGGSKGAAGGTTNVGSNPLVNIGYDADMNGYITPTSTYLTDHSALLAAPRAIVSGSVYGGSDAAKVTGNTAIFLRKRAKVFGNVYGGGNMGEVTGDTKVIVNGDNN